MKSLSGMERWEPAPSLPAFSPPLPLQLSGTAGQQNTGSSQQPLQRFHLEPAPLFRGKPSGKVGEMGEVESVCHEGEYVFP